MQRSMFRFSANELGLECVDSGEGFLENTMVMNCMRESTASQQR